MLRRPLLPLSAIAALMLATAAQAQEAPAPAAAPVAQAHRSYSPDQMSHFARATVELQHLGSRDPSAMTQAIQGAGMSVEDYNRMGDAMRADPKLASSLNPYLDSANTDRMARIYAERSKTPSFAGQPRHTATRHVASHKACSRSSHRSRSSAHKASHTRSTRRAHTTKASHHHAGASHHASRKTTHTSKKTSHATRKTTHKSAAAHKTSRHKRS